MADKKREIHMAEVVRHGDKLVVPEAMPIPAAIDVLQRQMKHEEQVIDEVYTFPVFPWDGAIALLEVMREQFGFAFMDSIPGGFFRPDQPPKIINVEVGPDQTVKVPWGMFRIPGSPEGSDRNYFLTGTGTNEAGQSCFQLSCRMQRLYQPVVERMVKGIREYIKEKSIYRGRALRLRFSDSDGELLEIPTVKFIDLAAQQPVVFNRDLERAVRVNVWTPIRDPEGAAKLGVPRKRGVLLAGKYGTGKTLVAYETARVAVEAGWTFLYVEHIKDLAHALTFAQQYATPKFGAVVFGEDIDRVLRTDSDEERTVEIDAILNTLDGVDSKGKSVFTILTTNHPELINGAMLRPGRIDVVLHVAAPDAEAAQRLVQVYAGTLLDQADIDLPAIGEALAGEIPAIIREVVERSKLASLERLGDADHVKINTADLMVSVFTVREQREFLEQGKRKPEGPSLTTALAEAVTAAMQGTQLAETVDKVHANVRVLASTWSTANDMDLSIKK